MYKNIITVILSIIIGVILSYSIGVYYFYINLDKERPYHLKDIDSLNFHKKYTSKLHHIKNPSKYVKIQDTLFTTLNSFKNKKNKILIQGDSWVATLTKYKKTNELFKKFAEDKNVGLINSGIGSYSPSLMNLQFDVLEKDFNILPNILVVYIDQSDLGDEVCRYKDKKVLDNDGKLVKIHEEKYSRNVFNYTKIHEESNILISHNSNLKKSIQLLNFNLSYSFLKQKNKIVKKIYKIKKYGFKNRKLKNDCNYSDIEKYLIDNDQEDILYFKKTITSYLDKISSKKYVKKILIISFPHRANLFPVKNIYGKIVEYKVNVSDIIDSILENYNNIDHLNFNDEIKGKEKYFYDNAYIDFDPHLNEEFHRNFYAKPIIRKLEEYLNY